MGHFFYKSYGFKKKQIFEFLNVLNFFLWHLIINLVDTCIGIFGKNIFFNYIDFKF